MENIKDIILREKEKKLFISRIPDNVKKEFIEFAEKEFCGDYGMCFKSIWNNYKEWNYFMRNFEIKLDYIISILSKFRSAGLSDENSPEMDKIKLLDGKEIKREVKSNGKQNR